MEPSSVEDGNLPSTATSCAAIGSLQWSRPQLRTETAQPARPTGY